MSEEHKAATKLLRTFQWLLFAVVTVLAVGFTIFAINDLTNPASEGSVGTVTVTSCDSTTYHNCHGNFNARDGRTSLSNVLISGVTNRKPGSQFTAYGSSQSDTVTVPSSEGTYTDIIVMSALIIAWLILIWRRVYIPLRKRRALRANAHAAGDLSLCKEK